MNETKWYRIQVLNKNSLPSKSCSLCTLNIKNGDYCYESFGRREGKITNIIHEECALRLFKDVLRNGIDL